MKGRVGRCSLWRWWCWLWPPRSLRPSSPVVPAVARRWLSVDRPPAMGGRWHRVPVGSCVRWADDRGVSARGLS